jgi:putative oxidoreductase
MTMDLGLLILQVVIGLLMMGHGAQKLFGWFGGQGLRATADWLASMGLRAPRFWALMAGLAEFGGGLLFALGLFHPIGPLAIIAVMIAAIALVHWSHGLWISNGGSEYSLVLTVLALVMGLWQPGAYTLDRVLGITLPQPQTFWVGLIIVLLGLAFALFGRQRRAMATPHSAGQATS